MQNLKYLAAYIVPLLSFLAVQKSGLYSAAPLLFAFILVPILEPLLKKSTKNLTNEEKASMLSNRFFDILLYLNLPIIILIVGLFIVKLHAKSYSSSEILILIFSIGTLIASAGINVAHELGHRDGKLEQFWAKALLIPALYMHFFIEHNRGHHKNIATPEDPASARLSETLYSFWVRSIWNGYFHAWKLEEIRLKKSNKPHISIQNEMVAFTLIQLTYLALIAFFTNPLIMLIMMAIAVVSFLLLETINYVEHYGLHRKKNQDGRYERVQAWHSWNSNHHLGRIVLYELTRHSDHHFQSNKKYQLLEHHDKSPQLPCGYPTSMILCLIPPLWFKIMNKKIKNFNFNISN